MVSNRITLCTRENSRHFTSHGCSSDSLQCIPCGLRWRAWYRLLLDAPPCCALPLAFVSLLPFLHQLNKDRDPAEWMRVGDTTGTAFLWYTVMLQIATACCSVLFLASEGENQVTETYD